MTSRLRWKLVSKRDAFDKSPIRPSVSGSGPVISTSRAETRAAPSRAEIALNGAVILLLIFARKYMMVRHFFLFLFIVVVIIMYLLLLSANSSRALAQRGNGRSVVAEIFIGDAVPGRAGSRRPVTPKNRNAHSCVIYISVRCIDVCERVCVCVLGCVYTTDVWIHVIGVVGNLRKRSRAAQREGNG